MRTQVEERFSEFFEKWVCQLEQLQQQLLKLSEETLQNEVELQALVSKVTYLHKEYYTVKWAAAREDVLAFFCPVWSSPLENAYNWVTGWKPSMLFQLIGSLRKTRLVNMSEEQLKKIEELRLKMRYEEEKVEREMERQQVAMADRRMVELARLESRVRNGGKVVEVEVEGLVDVALKVMLSGLERVMKAADCVRLKTLKGVLDVLSPLQCVEFLAATCMVQIRLRQWGRKKCDQNALLNH
ncbi:PREDICTED: mRNAion factor [Prunus dulcis]|uniref:PREDICTED: mRNAion factor n=1 Tax=Prunus dulcis TaxID=3755 RepID=A0A5E4G1Z0_PRUDU|nr:protein DOG1-like 4 [Prunus dulcis]VVA33759.1 PREDICTED: mRNAion factor [Prunus dulcis]